MYTTVGCRFPEVDKLTSQVLQLDEVTFYYDKDAPIFNNICISANMESRICIVSRSFRLCDRAFNLQSSDLMQRYLIECTTCVEVSGSVGSIRLETKLRLYQTLYIVPVLMYGCETWATAEYLLSRLDAFDTLSLRKILRTPYARHVSNAEVRRTTGCSPLSHLVTNRRVCGSSAILLAVHLARTTIEPLQRVPDKYRPTGSDHQEDLATLGSVQLRLTLAV